MHPVDLVVKGRVLDASGEPRRAAVAIRGGRIVSVGEAVPGARTLDVGDALVAPGAIDPHVHFRDPGHPEKEDFASGTKAAALGGVTTVLDMPNTSPPVVTREALDDKRRRAQEKACVDWGLYAGLDAQGASLSLLPDAVGMKIYLGATTGDLLVRDLALVRRAFEAAAAANRTVAVHAEDQDCLDAHAHLASDAYGSHADARPARCEAEAVRELAVVARGTHARVHVAHLSTAAGLDALIGTTLTAEVTPHHLLLDRKALERGGRYKMNPPLREPMDAHALLLALGTGRIACLASDHAPHTPGEKDAAAMGACPAGVPGVQTLVPLLLPLARKGGVPLARLLDASVGAARVFRLANKGGIAPGFDADLAVYDLDAETPVEAARMASKAGWTPYEGMPAIFPRHVLVRGEPVVEDGAFVGKAGAGREVMVAP